MQFYGKAESVATRIVEHFQSGNIPSALAAVFIRRHDAIPCRSWSWCNQLLTALASFDDARTYLDWQSAGRQVRKGERAFSILEPCKRKVKETDRETGEARERLVTYGFRAGARFGLEQTDIIDAEKWSKAGKRDESAERFLEALPLVAVARAWGLTVRSFNGREGSALGRYRRGESIAIGVENLSTWAHELVHAADDRLGELKENGQHWRSETVAELGGAVLLSCIGRGARRGPWRMLALHRSLRQGKREGTGRRVSIRPIPDVQGRSADPGSGRIAPSRVRKRRRMSAPTPSRAGRHRFALAGDSGARRGRCARGLQA